MLVFIAVQQCEDFCLKGRCSIGGFFYNVPFSVSDLRVYWVALIGRKVQGGASGVTAPK